MIKQTKNYDQFVLRPDNRADGISERHVKLLMLSLKSKNLLHLRPIAVTESMEVIDGQHRLEAAKRLGLPIYYEVEKNLEAKDVILMNVVKPWSASDFFNYYVKNGYPEYVKLEEFMKKNGLTLKPALSICVPGRERAAKAFREGSFKFNDTILTREMDACWQIIGFIGDKLQNTQYMRSGKFLRALLAIVRHPDFDMSRMMKNVDRLITRIGPRITQREYIDMFLTIYNYKAGINQTISIDDEEAA